MRDSRRILTWFRQVPPATTAQSPSGFFIFRMPNIAHHRLFVSLMFAASSASSVHFGATFRETRRSRRRKSLSQTPFLKSTPCLHLNTKVEFSHQYFCKSICGFNKYTSCNKKQNLLLTVRGSVLQKTITASCENPIFFFTFRPHGSSFCLSLFHWLLFFLITTLLLHLHFHFTLWIPDEPVTSPPVDRSSVAKKRFTLQGFGNLKSPKGNISSSGACWWCSVILGLRHSSCTISYYFYQFILHI